MRRGVALGLALLAFGALAPAAQASYHLMKISEVFPGTAANSYNDAFVELQMYETGQNFVHEKDLSYYTASGENTPFFNFGSDAGNGESQRTILVGDGLVANRDFTDMGLSNKPDILDPAGGAVCFGDVTPTPNERVDCVSWGSFTNAEGLPVGTPAAPGGIPDGQSLTRSIAPNCTTLLENADDTDDSSADFALASPSPRSNATAPSERPCTGPGGDGDPPQTSFRKRPDNRTEDRTPTFRFRSDERGSDFRCKVDRRRFKPCDSPFTTRRLSFGKHTVSVQAIDPAGNRDPSAARDTFTVVRDP